MCLFCHLQQFTELDLVVMMSSSSYVVVEFEVKHTVQFGESKNLHFTHKGTPVKSMHINFFKFNLQKSASFCLIVTKMNTLHRKWLRKLVQRTLIQVGTCKGEYHSMTFPHFLLDSTLPKYYIIKYFYLSSKVSQATDPLCINTSLMYSKVLDPSTILPLSTITKLLLIIVMNLYPLQK